MLKERSIAKFDAHTKISDLYELVNRDSKSVWTLYIFQLGERGTFLWVSS